MKRFITILCLVACMPMVWAGSAKSNKNAMKIAKAQAQLTTKYQIAGNESLRKRFYKRSGKTYFSLIGVGYSTFFLMPNNPQNYAVTEFTGKRHLLNLDIFSFRTGLFGMSLLNFEMGLNNTCVTASGDSLTTFMGGGANNDIIGAEISTMWFNYKPTINAYIPITDWLAATIYTGVDVDLCGLWYKIRPGYYSSPSIPANNFHLGIIAGAGLRFTPHGQFPMDIRCEYRHPVMGNTGIIPQGFYLTAQIGFGWVFKH